MIRVHVETRILPHQLSHCLRISTQDSVIHDQEKVEGEKKEIESPKPSKPSLENHDSWVFMAGFMAGFEVFLWLNLVRSTSGSFHFFSFFSFFFKLTVTIFFFFIFFIFFQTDRYIFFFFLFSLSPPLSLSLLFSSLFIFGVLTRISLFSLRLPFFCPFPHITP